MSDDLGAYIKVLVAVLPISEAVATSGVLPGRRVGSVC